MRCLTNKNRRFCSILYAKVNMNVLYEKVNVGPNKMPWSLLTLVGEKPEHMYVFKLLDILMNLH